MKIGTRRPSVSIGFIQSIAETRDLKRKAVDRRGLIRWRDVSSFGKLGNNDTSMKMKKEKKFEINIWIDLFCNRSCVEIQFVGQRCGKRTNSWEAIIERIINKLCFLKLIHPSELKLLG